jgi:hypothetical protein
LIENSNNFVEVGFGRAQEPMIVVAHQNKPMDSGMKKPGNGAEQVAS